MRHSVETGTCRKCPRSRPAPAHPHGNLCEWKLCEVSVSRAPPQLAPRTARCSAGTRADGGLWESARSLEPRLPQPPFTARPRPARRPRAAVPARSRPGLRRSLPRASLRVTPRPHRLAPGTSPETDGEAEPHSLSFRATHSRGPAPGLRVPARALTHGPRSCCPASPDQRPWTSGTRRARVTKFSQPLLSSRRRGE